MPNPPLDPKLKRQIEADCHLMSSRAVSRKYGVAVGTVANIRNHRTSGTLPADEQIMFLRGRNAELSSEVARLHHVLGSRKEMAAEVAKAVTAAEPFKRVPWKSPARAGKPVEAVLKVSDWQIGEVIDPAQTEGFGAFDWNIAQQRMFRIVDSFLRWVEMMRTCYRIDRCRIFREGDLVSGNIHKELEITNEFPVPVATARAGLLLGEVGVRVAPHFGAVIIEGTDADNHGRLNPKPQAKQKAENNWCYLTAVIANETLKKHGNVRFDFDPGIKHLANVNGFNFLIEHGDTIKAWMGIPYYGMERERAREATKRMNTERTFHYQSCGHWHVPAWLSGNILINGSLTGTTEFDHSCGRHALPAQVAFLVHPEHGVFNFTPFRA